LELRGGEAAEGFLRQGEFLLRLHGVVPPWAAPKSTRCAEGGPCVGARFARVGRRGWGTVMPQWAPSARRTCTCTCTWTCTSTSTSTSNVHVWRERARAGWTSWARRARRLVRPATVYGPPLQPIDPAGVRSYRYFYIYTARRALHSSTRAPKTCTCSSNVH